MIQYPPEQRLYESTGLPWDGELADVLNQQDKRVKGNMASCIIIDGSVGAGKTTLMNHLIDYAEDRLIDPALHIGIGGQRFQEKLAYCIANKLGNVGYDEAGDFDKRGAIGQFNMNLIKIFQKYRAFKIKLYMALPLMTILETRLFWMGIPRCLIHVEREVGHSYAKYSVYDGARMMWLKKRMDDIVVPQMAYRMVRPNFRGQFHDLDPARAKILSDLGLQFKTDDLTDSIIKGQNLKTPSQMGRDLGRGRAWVCSKLKALNLKPNAIYRKKRYYGQEITTKLGELI
jgi:hypothetical protein